MHQNQKLFKKTILTLYQKINSHKRSLVAVSGGSDSDIMVDLIQHMDCNSEVIYAFYDTGIEYEATKRHLDELEQKYNINILRYKAKTPVPLGVKKYGVPFLSKKVAEYCSRLQRYNFTWDIAPFSELIEKYPKCRASLRWWCSDFGINSSFNINKNKLLREYINENIPKFNISPMCCQGAKKDSAKYLEKEIAPDMNITGVRRAEGGGKSHIVYELLYA